MHAGRVFRFAGKFLVLLMVVLLSGLFQTALAAENSAIITYDVKKGDTYWLLSQRYGTGVTEIQKINGASNIDLDIGQILFLPVLLENDNYIYRVQTGDTLDLIALRANWSVSIIKEANKLDGEIIYAGQSLLIPPAGPGTTAYRVQSGDSLYLIARKFNITIEELTRWNKLPGTMILVGQILQIPISDTSLPDVLEQDLPVYRVKSGDTLSTIAAAYRSSVQAIYLTNRLNSDILMPGQPLYIPVDSKEAVTVAVPQGTKKAGFGELLDWEWARWIYNVGATARVTDLQTGLSFQVRHLGGSNHADSEPLTAADTAVMKQVFNGQWSWNTRAVLIKVGNRILAASIAGQPHDIQTIYDNNFPGHFDIYFWNSRSHNTNEIQPAHQANVLIAAGQ